jgi:hypothetical protein
MTPGPPWLPSTVPPGRMLGVPLRHAILPLPWRDPSDGARLLIWGRDRQCRLAYAVGMERVPGSQNALEPRGLSKGAEPSAYASAGCIHHPSDAEGKTPSR